MAHKIRSWSRQDLLDHLQDGKHNIKIAGEPETLRLIGAGFHGAITKNSRGRIDEFPLRMIVSIT